MSVETSSPPAPQARLADGVLSVGLCCVALCLLLLYWQSILPLSLGTAAALAFAALLLCRRMRVRMACGCDVDGTEHGDRACGTNSGITRVWSPYSPVTGGSTPSSHHHQAQQPQGGLWRLGGGPSADPGPGRPPTPVAGAAGPRSKCRGILPLLGGRSGASRGQASEPTEMAAGSCNRLPARNLVSACSVPTTCRLMPVVFSAGCPGSIYRLDKVYRTEDGQFRSTTLQ